MKTPDLEILAQREQDAKLKLLRSEFFLLWPDIWTRHRPDGPTSDELPFRELAWKLFRKAKNYETT